MLYSWLEGNNDALALKADRKEWLVCMPLTKLQERFRPIKPHPMISTNPKICSGDPIIKGIRIRVADILKFLKTGLTIEEICEDYNLTNEQIHEAIDYVVSFLDRN
ncbi:Uncharacterized conserved protein, DUF433 family [Seinonella peptonophila]|uniref:Uncharacterized conserved protein, DUF433 family n=2 Tax=Seinonella peptonophila TaxID=112248 RepID=A0A1M4ZQH1_9BACL|nr:Uncharacterized conserved protein, DUF433 family [Seinonella peptonophila]